MSNEKKQSAKHFLQTETGFKKLLKASREDVPSEKTLIAIRDYSVRTGKLHGLAIPGTAAFYLNFILGAEQKSNKEVAKELGVSVEDLKLLQRNLEPISDRSLLEVCGEFVNKHPQFTLRPLFTLLKRAIVLQAMISTETSIRKAARKKPKN